MPLMDNGHYHPTEVVSDKIPALLCFFPEIALHITRPIRWDSDHVVLFDDETKEFILNGDHPLDFKNLKFTRNTADSQMLWLDFMAVQTAAEL